MDKGLPTTQINTKKLKVLWLCSWFPHRGDPYDGDFVFRHAETVAALHEVYVIHVVQNVQLLRAKSSFYTQSVNDGLTAAIFYPPYYHKLPIFLSKIIFNYQYRKTLKQAMHAYLQAQGKPDLVHVHVPVKAGWGARYLKRKMGIPFVLTEHSSAYFKGIENGYFTRGYHFRKSTSKTIKEAAVISSVSNWLVNRLQFLFRQQAAMVVRNVTDNALFYPVMPSHRKKRFIHVSMMRPLKNVIGIVHAFAQLSADVDDWELIIVGPMDPSLAETIEQLGLGSKIRLKGLLTYELVAAEMRTSDVLVHFSRYENLPCVIQEALCCGLFVISSDVGGINEIVNAQNGRLVSENDIIALKTALSDYLLGKYEHDRFQISAASAALFSKRVVAAQFDQLYRLGLQKQH